MVNLCIIGAVKIHYLFFWGRCVNYLRRMTPISMFVMFILVGFSRSNAFFAAFFFIYFVLNQWYLSHISITIISSFKFSLFEYKRLVLFLSTSWIVNCSYLIGLYFTFKSTSKWYLRRFSAAYFHQMSVSVFARASGSNIWIEKRKR